MFNSLTHYKHGNKHILEYNLHSHSVRMKRVPEILENSYIHYTPNGPRLTDSPTAPVKVKPKLQQPRREARPVDIVTKTVRRPLGTTKRKRGVRGAKSEALVVESSSDDLEGNGEVGGVTFPGLL